MSVPTRDEAFTKLIEALRTAQEQAAIIAHLHNANVAEGLIGPGSSSKERAMALAWLAISELMKMIQDKVIKLAQGRMQ